MNKQCSVCGKEANMLSWQDKCYPCQRKAYTAALKEEIEETGKTECESEIYCPWCGSVYEVDDEYSLYEDGEHDCECPNC